MAEGYPNLKNWQRFSHHASLLSSRLDGYDARGDQVGDLLLCGKAANLKYLSLPNPREWSPSDEDWKLPSNWKEIVLEGLEGEAGEVPVPQDLHGHLRAVRGLRGQVPLLHRRRGPQEHAGAEGGASAIRVPQGVHHGRKDPRGSSPARGIWTTNVLKEWWYYFFQCTECRRCSLFCPYGIDTAEITIIARELLNLLGLNTDWISAPAANCYRTGNHLGIQPHAYKDMIDFFLDDIEEITGIRMDPSFNRKGAEILFITPSGDVFADPGTYTCMGYLILFHYLQSMGLDLTWSTFASEGGNFGYFTSHEMAKRLNAKMYAEAKRLGVKWILGGECGHMWRVINQYMDTFNGPADFLEAPGVPHHGDEVRERQIRPRWFTSPSSRRT